MTTRIHDLCFAFGALALMALAGCFGHFVANPGASSSSTGQARFDSVTLLIDKTEINRMTRHYPHGYNFIDPVCPDGGVTWHHRRLVGGGVECCNVTYPNLGELLDDLEKFEQSRMAAVEVHQPLLKDRACYEEITSFIDSVRRLGFVGASGVSD